MAKDKKRVIEIPVFDTIVVSTAGKPDEVAGTLKTLGAEGYQVAGVVDKGVIVSKQTGIKEVEI